MEGDFKAGPNPKIDNQDPANLDDKVKAILNGDSVDFVTDDQPVKLKRQRDYAKEYAQRAKKKKKKRVVQKIKTDVSSPGTDPAGSVNPPNSDSKSEYEKYKEAYLSSLDGDAKDPQGPDSLVGDPGQVDQPDVDPKNHPRPKFGSSLVLITRFCLPIFCVLGVRIASRGKKRPDRSAFRLSDEDTAMLKELADEGAGEELLGGVNKSLIYGIVVLALGGSMAMEHWDKDTYQLRIAEIEEMKKEIAEMRVKLNGTFSEEKEVQSANIIPID